MRFCVRVALSLAVCLLVCGADVAAQEGPVREGSETVAKPRKPAETPEEAAPEGDKIPSKFDKTKQPAESVPSFKSDVINVTVDVAVLDNKGHFIPGIPRGNFRILEDNVPQPVTGFNLGEAPMTVAMVIEFSNKFQSYYSQTWYQTLMASWGFLQTLKPEDYVAIVAYDMRSEILCDFTNDKNKIEEALHRLSIPAWREANMFDAVTDTADRMSGIEGRKAILLITSGIDTFSKLTYDQTRKSLQQSGVPVYAISLMGMQRAMSPRGDNITFLQADNELRTFAKETGGQVFFPRFEGEYQGIFQQVQMALRNQYVITYSPSNKTHDGTYRKIKVQLVDHDGNPIALKDEKGKPLKYTIIAKQGYKAPRAVE